MDTIIHRRDFKTTTLNVDSFMIDNLEAFEMIGIEPAQDVVVYLPSNPCVAEINVVHVFSTIKNP